MIASKKRSEAMRSVQSMLFETENFSIKALENIDDMQSGNAIRMRATVGTMRLIIKSLCREPSVCPYVSVNYFVPKEKQTLWRGSK